MQNYMWSKTAYYSNYNIPAIRHGGGSIMLPRMAFFGKDKGSDETNFHGCKSGKAYFTENRQHLVSK